jgi:hypothetical protein
MFAPADCRWCGATFEKTSANQWYCSPEHAHEQRLVDWRAYSKARARKKSRVRWRRQYERRKDRREIKNAYEKKRRPPVRRLARERAQLEREVLAFAVYVGKLAYAHLRAF